MRRCERRSEDEKMLIEQMFRRCEDEKMFYRPPLLEEPCAQTLSGKTQGFVLRLPPQNIAHATFMQPFQCDLQPQLQEPHRTTHTGTTTRCKTHRRNNSRQKRPQPHPPHRRGTFHRWLQPLYTEKHKVSCSGFLPKT